MKKPTKEKQKTKSDEDREQRAFERRLLARRAAYFRYVNSFRKGESK